MFGWPWATLEPAWTQAARKATDIKLETIMPPRKRKESAPASPSAAGDSSAFLDAMIGKLPDMSTPPPYTLSAANSSIEPSPEPVPKRKRTAGPSKLKEEISDSMASEILRDRDRALVSDLIKEEAGHPPNATAVEKKRKRLAADEKEKGKLGEPWTPEEDYAMFCAIFPRSSE